MRVLSAAQLGTSLRGEHTLQCTEMSFLSQASGTFCYHFWRSKKTKHTEKLQRADGEQTRHETRADVDATEKETSAQRE